MPSRPIPQSGRDDQPFGWNVFEPFADQIGDLVRPLDLQRVVVDDADHDLLVLWGFAIGAAALLAAVLACATLRLGLRNNVTAIGAALVLAFGA
jgi:hypothetical protein